MSGVGVQHAGSVEVMREAGKAGNIQAIDCRDGPRYLSLAEREVIKRKTVSGSAEALTRSGGRRVFVG